MKHILTALLLLSSTSVFASSGSNTTTGTNECADLAGEYTCSYRGQNIDLNIVLNPEFNSITLNIGGEGGEFVVDGVKHDSSTDDTTYIAKCSNNEMSIGNYFAGELRGTISVIATETGVDYKLVKSSSPIVLSCPRK
ncbi:MAG: hypothetical protein KDD38_06060 [Bdellovibrionales bacterium]|nr:hypothetical protein [Bdellovibrionales bacterium]